jgi:hypothetical protein
MDEALKPRPFGMSPGPPLLVTVWGLFLGGILWAEQRPLTAGVVIAWAIIGFFVTSGAYVTVRTLWHDYVTRRQKD